MPNRASSIIIIGAGIAGAHAAQTIRDEGFSEKIILFDRANDLPYDRPPLSKEYMLGDVDEEGIILLDQAKLEELNIDFKREEEVISIDVENNEVVTDKNTTYRFQKLLLATGSKLRTLHTEGSNLKEIYYLRTLADAKKIKEKLPHIKKIVIIGAGFIGAEMASTCKRYGIDVTMIERAPIPMAHIFGDDIGQFFLNLHQSNDINIITKDSVKAFYGDVKVERVVTMNGISIDCEAVIVGIGVNPNTCFTHELLAVEKGYVVNEFGETSIPDVFAAGDCAMWPYNGSHIHIEHWDHALNHGKAVAKNMIRPQPEPYHRVPYFWSEQYNHRIQYIGYCTSWATTVLRGNIEECKFTYFYIDKNNCILAALIVNEPRSVLQIRRLVNGQHEVDRTILEDSNTSLKEVRVN